jgi:hypothetical protein
LVRFFDLGVAPEDAQDGLLIDGTIVARRWAHLRRNSNF